MSEQLVLASLIFREDLYPRQKFSEAHVRELKQAMDGGQALPPIIVADNYIIVDGVHRYHAALRTGATTILGDVREYASEADLFKDATLLNTAHGLNLQRYDQLKVIETAERLGLHEFDISAILRTSIQQLRAIKPKFAILTETQSGMGDLRRKVPLKESVRHLSGQVITQDQEEAIRGNAPGMSYLVGVRQLISAIEHDLLPPEDKYPVLWQELRRLQSLIQ
jgi:ParB-like nuclease family protein